MPTAAPLTATPVFIEVRAFQTSQLCFEVGGLLDESFVELGTEVRLTEQDLAYNALRAAFPKSPDDPGRLFFDSSGIDNFPSFSIHSPKQPDNRIAVLATLRAEPIRAALNKAVNTRHNAYITKYSPAAIAAVTKVLREVFSVKGNQINTLSQLSEDMTNKLDTAYTQFADHNPNNANSHGVVIGTGSETNDGEDTGTITTTSDGPNDPPTKQTTSTKQTVAGSIRTTDIEFRVPSIENQARNQRAQISLGDEAVSFTMESHYQDKLEQIFANELASIDADVNRMQVAYMNTILRSPIDGIVTGVYKNPGELVRAGEPVFRIENDAIVLIVANIVWRGPVLIGQILLIKTTLFNGTGPSVSIEAVIVAARGQGDDDQWEVIGKGSNIDTAGKKIFPLGYRFDTDIKKTQVSILASNEI